MSFFAKTITVPKNTPSTSPLADTIEIQAGVIHRVRVSIPSGHAGLTGIHILRGLHQIAPTSGTEWFTGDDAAVDYQEFIEVLESPFMLYLEAYNEDDTYDHTFVVSIGVLPRYVLLPQEILQSVLQTMSSLLQSVSGWFSPGSRM